MPDQPVSVYTVVRQILAGNLDLSSEEVIPRARGKGVTRSAADLRKIINNVRSDMRASKKTKGRKAPAASGPAVYTLAREILTADMTLSNDEVFARIKARGATKSDSGIRDAIRSTRSELRHKVAVPVPAAARTVPEPKPATEVPGESALLAGVALVNKTAQLCGGFAKSREIAEAIRACGGIDAFLKRLELVAEILGPNTEL